MMDETQVKGQVDWDGSGKVERRQRRRSDGVGGYVGGRRVVRGGGSEHEREGSGEQCEVEFDLKSPMRRVCILELIQ